MAMAEREIRDAALPDIAGVADHAGLAVGQQRGVGRVESADVRRYGGRAIIRGQQDLGRGRILQFDKIGFVLDDKRGAEAAG